MRRTAAIRVGIVALGMGLAAHSVGKEMRVQRADVPGAVLAAVSARYTAATMVQFIREESHGKVTFEVTVELGTERREIDVSPVGKIIAEERPLPFQDLPSGVRDAFARSRFGRDNVLRVEQSTEYVPAEKAYYELLVKVRTRTLELVYDAKGELVRQEPGERD